VRSCATIDARYGAYFERRCSFYWLCVRGNIFRDMVDEFFNGDTLINDREEAY